MAKGVNRREVLLRELLWHWNRLPDLRLGQLLDSALSRKSVDIFYVGDNELIDSVRTFHEEVTGVEQDGNNGS